MDRPLEVSIEVRGKRHSGSYRVQDGRVTVYYYDRERSEPAAGQPPEIVAESLLRNLVAEIPSASKVPVPNPRGPQLKS